MSIKATIQKHQVIMDMAIQYAGTAESLFDLAILNSIGITDEIDAGTLLLMPDVAEVKPFTFLKQRGIKPVTLIPSDNELSGEGIEFWAVEYDFIVT